MLSHVLGFLQCPHCHTEFTMADSRIRCVHGHCFDIAQQGHVNLLTRTKPLGDTAEMLAARVAFLQRGHYAPIAHTIARALGEDIQGNIVDVGAGPGYYLATLLDFFPRAVGTALDASRFATRRAAKAHARIGAVICDAWRPLPLKSASAAAVLTIFAPRNGLELHRVLQSHGQLIVVTPTSQHLAELVTTLDLLTVDEHKQQRLAAQLDPYFDLTDQTHLHYPLSLTHEDVQTVVQMGPNAWHTDPHVLDVHIGQLHEPVSTTASVNVSVYRARS